MAEPGKPDTTRPIPSIKPPPPPQDPSRTRTVSRLFLDETNRKRSLIEVDPATGRSRDMIRREIEQRKKRALGAKLSEEAEVVEGIARVRKTVLYIVGLMIVAFAGWRIHVVYDGQWPLMLTWGVIAVAILGGFGWLFWYVGPGE